MYETKQYNYKIMHADHDKIPKSICNVNMT
jgi:hypothetical protein